VLRPATGTKIHRWIQADVQERVNHNREREVEEALNLLGVRDHVSEPALTLMRTAELSERLGCGSSRWINTHSPRSPRLFGEASCQIVRPPVAGG
jgi:hypothetical protein